jgi:hypothetical protein
MVIFNVWAMVVVPVIFFVLLYVHSYLPSFVAEPHGNVVTSIIALLISGICEIFGLRSRLFFMPIWLISIFAFCYSAFRLWGYMSIGLFVVMLVIFVIVTNKLTQKSEI